MRGDPLNKELHIPQIIEASRNIETSGIMYASLEAPFYDSRYPVLKNMQPPLLLQTLGFLDQIQSVFHLEIKPYNFTRQFRSNGYNGPSL